ncbi:hypothetical protein AVEN_227878-1, partial [Araneus ventricosus]
MNLLPILLFGAGVATCVYGNAIPAGYDAENFCPPPEDIAPCTCFKAPITNRVTARCSKFTNSYEIKAIFDRNPNWDLQDVWIDESVMPFLPAKMLEEAHFQTLNVSSTSLVTLFDKTPVTTPGLNLYLYDVKILRGFRWSEIANSNLLLMKTRNMNIRSLGQDFKDNIPKGVRRLSFENTGITSIRNRAFSDLRNLKILEIRRGSLKKMSRDWFPRPWNLTYLDFSYHKIAALPDDIFADIPMLSFFVFEGNLLSTISEKVFTKHTVFYAFK